MSYRLAAVARDISHLEPADRDPAQLRRTGLTITAIMVIGGVAIMAAYILKQRGDAKDDRPHVVGRLEEVFGGRDQHNKAFTTKQLMGKITFVTPLAGSEKARTAESLRILKLVAEKFPEDTDLRFVGITVEAEQDGPEQFKAMLSDLGVGEDGRWFFVQAEEKNARGYLRHNLRLETVEEIPSPEGPIKRFRSTIVILDQNLHLLEPQFDFNFAREVQEEARELLETDPEMAEERNASAHTDHLEKAEERLFRTIEHIRKGDLKEGKQ